MSKRLKIFIASASKYLVKDNNKTAIEKTKNDKLKPIFDVLNKCEFETVPWFGHGVFFQGNSDLENLISVSKRLDGGIFVLGDDNEDVEAIPNLNVLLEAGMFLASKGIKKTFFVIDNLDYTRIKEKVSD